MLLGVLTGFSHTKEEPHLSSVSSSMSIVEQFASLVNRYSFMLQRWTLDFRKGGELEFGLERTLTLMSMSLSPSRV